MVPINPSSEMPQTLPDDFSGDVLRMVTAFHLGLPYDDQPLGNAGRRSQDSLRSACRLVSPHAGLFTCHQGKTRHLRRPVDSYSGWDAGNSSDVDIPEHEGVQRISQFYTECAESVGFTVPEDRGAPVRTWSRYRFSPPYGILLLRGPKDLAGILQDEHEQGVPVERQSSGGDRREESGRENRSRRRSETARPVIQRTKREPDEIRENVEVTQAAELADGDGVRHPLLGRGKVVQTPKSRRGRVKVAFDGRNPVEISVAELERL